ncbi:MAG TPA: hypothetical protein VJB35_03830 [Candidatus Nanoarchaeia archaeon]|nr:hypothetical protein [Candidatus Nanoarchaeia archaeon]
MNLPFELNYYLKNGVVRKITPDISRANFLFEESQKSFEGLKIRVEKIGIDEFSANSIIKDIHDIILQILRSKMLFAGLSASGNYAHEAEVSYMNFLGFNQSQISFVNTLRKSRNGINYYGKMFEKGYANDCYKFLKMNSKRFGL